MSNTPRLFINQELKINDELCLKETQFHYLVNVLRLGNEDVFLAFDNKNGEFECKIRQVGKKHLEANVERKTKEFAQSPDIWLLFAPIKKDKTDFIIEKSTELGVRKIIPTITKRAIRDKIKKERFEAQAAEAAEQCRRVDLPEIVEATPLEQVLKDWDKNRLLYFMDESGNGDPIKDVFEKNAHPPCAAAILVGPEGGFEESELATLRKLDFARGVSLGNRILRAETAVAAALACWQAICGDWKGK